MARIRSKDTAPEILVRKLLRSMRVRFKANLSKMPGKPDILLKGSVVLMFIHGCFWHRCPLKSCRRSNMPKSNQGYWGPKLSKNVARDRKNIKTLKKMGWKPYIIWECQTRSNKRLKSIILKILVKNNIGYIRPKHGNSKK